MVLDSRLHVCYLLQDCSESDNCFSRSPTTRLYIDAVFYTYVRNSTRLIRLLILFSISLCLSSIVFFLLGYWDIGRFFSFSYQLQIWFLQPLMISIQRHTLLYTSSF